MSFKAGSSYLLSDMLSLGISFNILFGSSRQNEVMNFGGSAVVQSSRMRFYGLLNEFFISVSLMDNLKLFSSYMYSIKPLEGVYEEKHLFDDAATASNFNVLEFKGRAPNALIASINKDSFFFSTKSAIS